MLFTALITPFMSASLIGLPAEISESAMQKHLPFISFQPYLKLKQIIYPLKNSSTISTSCKFITALTNTRKPTRMFVPCGLLSYQSLSKIFLLKFLKTLLHVLRVRQRNKAFLEFSKKGFVLLFRHCMDFLLKSIHIEIVDKNTINMVSVVDNPFCIGELV